MALKNQDLEVVQGQDFKGQLTITDENGVPVNLTGRTFKGQVRSAVGQPLAATFVITPANQMVSPGVINFILPGADTKKLPIKAQKAAIREVVQFLYDQIMIFPEVENKSPVRIMQGVINLSPSITE